jgi:hypothetical protein
LRAWQEKNENLFLSYCKKDVDNLYPLAMLSALPVTAATNKTKNKKRKNDY